VRFIEAGIEGVFVVELEPWEDERGLFMRIWGREEFREFDSKVVQVNLSLNRQRGTVRGLHYQDQPHADSKLFTCVRGSTHHVCVDVRPGSPSRGEHVAGTLREDERRSLYVPGLFACGYQSLTDETALLYCVDEAYVPEAERGLRFDDPALDIDWPLEPTQLSEKDRGWPLLTEELRG
jgi:dTDP-4-dehydrorhamnose 3,5-epimerase